MPDIVTPDSIGELRNYLNQLSTFNEPLQIDMVLSGGACVSIDTHNQYASYDLDFINAHFVKRQRIQAALVEIVSQSCPL